LTVKWFLEINEFGKRTLTGAALSASCRNFLGLEGKAADVKTDIRATCSLFQV